MIQRTVSGKIADATPQPVELPRWEALDEWEKPVVLHGRQDAEWPILRVFRAIDATAAAEKVAEYLISECDRELDGEVILHVKSLPNGDWQRVIVDVWTAIEYEVSARSVSPRPMPKRRRATA